VAVRSSVQLPVGEVVLLREGEEDRPRHTTLASRSAVLDLSVFLAAPLQIEGEATSLQLPRGTSALRREEAGHRTVALQRRPIVDDFDVALATNRGGARGTREADGN